jgi:N-acetylneuraminate synthase
MNNKYFDDLFIFEMANNHQGDVMHGVKIIKEMAKIARKYNINAGVKLQYRNLETFIHPDFKNNQEIKHIKRFEETKLSNQDFYKLVETIKDEGMYAICTPFDETSVDLCIDHGIDILKIGSCSADDWPLLEKISSARKPIIVSTGGKTISDIDKIFNFFTHRKASFAILHCIGIYPVPNDKIQMDFIERLKKRYPNIPIGYSGHEDPENFDIVKTAIAKGAKILERHVGVETELIKLNKYSSTPSQVDEWVRSALTIKDICSLKNKDKYIPQEEIDSLNSLKRGIYASRDIKKGEKINKTDIFFAMPLQENQTESGHFHTEMIASKEYKFNEPINEPKKHDTIKLVRSVIHDAKGMLYEANISIGDQFEVELSHHYGMDHFRQYGAIIVNIVNREYCKKLIIVLPGQQHPNHYHKSKEETFQLLYGDLEVNLENKQILLKPGDILTVERYKMHSFASNEGAIFEEISTTHIKNDSYYEDEIIRKMDPIERKTILKNW